MDDTRAAEIEYSDLYMNHLYLSRYAHQWAEQVRQDAYRDPQDAEYLGGYAQAVTDIAVHLAEGVGLPGGPIYTRIAEEASAASGSGALA